MALQQEKADMMLLELESIAESRWDLREDGELVLSFNWHAARSEYLTDRGEPLGRVWDAAVSRARSLAGERKASRGRSKG